MVSESSSAGVSPMRRMSLLASIVNSRDFRQPENDPMSFRRATEQLAELGDEFSVEGARLQHVRHLGEGAFAKVELYKLRPKPSESMLTGDARQDGTVLVAVKTMKELVPGPPDPKDPEQKPTLQPAPASWKAEFYAEAALLVGLRHENVVRSLGTAKKKDGQMMLIQEFMAGGSLGDQLRRPRYSGLQSLRWMRDLACGMEYLHTALDIPIAHRDLKPANVLLDKNGVAKVADLGLFRMLANHGRDTLAKLESERASAAAADGEMSEARDAAPGMRRLSTLSPTAEEMADGGPDSNTSEKEGGRRASRRVEGPGERRARSPRSPSTHPLPHPATTLRSLHHSSAKPGKTYTSSPHPPRPPATPPPPSRLTPLAPRSSLCRLSWDPDKPGSPAPRRPSVEEIQADQAAFESDDEELNDAAAGDTNGADGGNGTGRSKSPRDDSPTTKWPSFSRKRSPGALPRSQSEVGPSGSSSGTSSPAIHSPDSKFHSPSFNEGVSAVARRASAIFASGPSSSREHLSGTVADFGFAPPPAKPEELDLTGQTGSARYMAPEVHRGEQYNQTVDVYSFGIVAWEMFTRSRAYERTYMSSEQIAAAVAGDQALRPKVPPHWPQALAELVTSCWHPDPMHRPDFGEVIMQLRALIALGEDQNGQTEDGAALLLSLAPKSTRRWEKVRRALRGRRTSTPSPPLGGSGSTVGSTKSASTSGRATLAHTAPAAL